MFRAAKYSSRIFVFYCMWACPSQKYLLGKGSAEVRPDRPTELGHHAEKKHAADHFPIRARKSAVDRTLSEHSPAPLRLAAHYPTQFRRLSACLPISEYLG